MVRVRLILLAGLLLAAIALFLLWNLRAPYGFILSLRAEKLVALILVGAAAGAATVMFQTIAANRLLTPGIIGFDSLYVLMQTGLIGALGSAGYATLPEVPKFIAETLCMMGAAMALFGILFRKGAEDIVKMILTGVILGVLLRGLAGLAQRLLDPSEFAVVQQASVATFNTFNDDRLWIAAVVLIAAMALGWRMAPELDVAGFGRVKARTLGLNHDRLVLGGLAVVAAMVAVSTALAGPIVFLGLLAAGLANAALPVHSHRVLIPAAALIGAVILVLGQAVFERMLGLQSALAIVVEFAGGVLFLALVLRRRAT